MSDTIDRQLEHLAELHADGALTDDEFASAKANALTPASTAAAGTPTTPETVLAAGKPDPSIPPKLVWLLLFFAALVIGITITGLSAGFEWAPAQTPAAPIVCPGGELVVGFDVQYAVATKGVDFASVCAKNGVAHEVSDLWLSTVMTVEYTLVFLAVFWGWRYLWLRKQAKSVPVTPGGGAPLGEAGDA